MTRRKWCILGGAGGVIAAGAVAAAALLAHTGGIPSTYTEAKDPPRIVPDYTDIVIPPNIAPMNFRVSGPGSAFRARISGDKGRPIDISGNGPDIIIPIQPWRELLAANRGGGIGIDVFSRDGRGRWTKFRTVHNKVAQEEIDPYLAYRLLNPSIHNWAHLGLFQRRLSDYGEREILHSTNIQTSCCNCHSFYRNRPDTMLIHVRPGPIFPSSGMLVWRDGKLTKVDTRTKKYPRPVAYTSWHPNGRVAAFSVQKFSVYTHSIGREIRDHVDYICDLAVYDVQTRTLAYPPEISAPDAQETFPCWSADGKYLYFCRAPVLWTDPRTMEEAAIERHKEVKFDLVRIRYDDSTAPPKWGEVEVVLSSKATGLSILEPKASPDGRFLLVTMCDYGSFPVFRESADLYLVDPEKKTYRKLECSSDQSESWHSWSTNGRWVVFSSRRGSPQFARPHFTYIDAEGKDSKAWVLPQEDPSFYDSCTQTYNIPEFVTGPVQVTEDQLIQALLTSTDSAVPVTGATAKSAAPSPK
ncbi:MAG: hypothetical protein ACE15C_03890 [Phycisphaerae bacterium]